ncbi:MAG: Fic family protein [Marinagarivorans sp.]|nr:Fic family protein [Marinagarivorans sp.]
MRGDVLLRGVLALDDKPHVHFEAPPKAVLEPALAQFLAWFNQRDAAQDPLIRAAITHLWFVTLHPFDDGNGRITRALTDMALAQADAQSIRLFSSSAGIWKIRSVYTTYPEPQTHRVDMDITDWILWFLQTLNQSLNNANTAIHTTLQKRFLMHCRRGFFYPSSGGANRLLEGGKNGFEDGISAANTKQ